MAVVVVPSEAATAAVTTEIQHNHSRQTAIAVVVTSFPGKDGASSSTTHDGTRAFSIATRHGNPRSFLPTHR